MPRKDSTSRMHDVTPEELRQLAARFRRAAATMTGLAAVMEETKVKSISVDGRKMVDRAFDSINSFAGNCQKRIGGF